VRDLVERRVPADDAIEPRRREIDVHAPSPTPSLQRMRSAPKR
jgi:hypothetical protein